LKSDYKCVTTYQSNLVALKMNVAETIFLNVLVGAGEQYYAPTCKVM